MGGKKIEQKLHCAIQVVYKIWGICYLQINFTPHRPFSCMKFVKSFHTFGQRLKSRELLVFMNVFLILLYCCNLRMKNATWSICISNPSNVKLRLHFCMNHLLACVLYASVMDIWVLTRFWRQRNTMSYIGWKRLANFMYVCISSEI